MKVKGKFFIIISCFTFCISVLAQNSTKESPISYNRDVPQFKKNDKTVKSLPSIDISKLLKEDEEDEVKGNPPRFGYRHKVDYNLDNSGEWVILDNGDRIWRLNINCPNSKSINLLYDKFWIPEQAKLFIYNNEKTHSIDAITSINNNGEKNKPMGNATGLVYGNSITLEYFVPKDVSDIGVISIAYVVHGYKYILLPNETTESYSSSGDCQVNVNCTEGANWKNEKNAVAMILINGYRMCTGSLINNTSNDYRPLFLTANHCLDGGDAVSSPNLSHWSFYWHYETPYCNNSSYEPSFKTTVGAKILANNSYSDFALLELTQDPQSVSGITPYYLGWDYTSNVASGGVGIHHPSGDVKKIATLNHSTASSGVYWQHYWDGTTNGYSVTEGGSSGSPLINSSRRVVGQLYGGSSINCSNPSQDLAMYGKFNLSWTGNGSSDNKRKLQPWVDPIGKNPYTFDGLCNETVLFNNRTVSYNTNLTSCGKINIQNVTIGNNSKLTVRAPSNVLINGTFEVQSGSQLEMN
jgi:Trypsin.